MVTLRPYSSRTHGQDFTVYFTEQVTAEAMQRSYASMGWGQFLIWTTHREEGVTIAWVQFKIPVTRVEVETEYFPDACWVGTTDVKQEYDSWFHGETMDRYRFEGRFDNRGEHTDGMVSGRATVLEILACVVSMREDWHEDEDGLTEDEGGVLVRTQPVQYPVGGI